MEVAVAAKDLELAFSIVANNSVYNMVHSFGLLRVSDTPVSDRFKFGETFLDSKLTFVLLKLFLLL